MSPASTTITHAMVCKMLGVSPYVSKRLIAAGNWPPHSVIDGGTRPLLRYDLLTVQRWIAARATRAERPAEPDQTTPTV